MSKCPVFCLACEASDLVQRDLGYFADDGTTGRVAGLACRACGYIRADAQATYVPEGHVELNGMTALVWLLTGLRAAGCDPRPRQ